MTKTTPAQLRAHAEAAIRPLGKKRLRLLAQLDEVDAELRPLVLAAREVEVPLRRITELTAYTANTVRAWARKAEAAESP